MKMAAAQCPARRSRELGVPLLSALSEQSAQQPRLPGLRSRLEESSQLLALEKSAGSLSSPWPPAALRAHPACDRHKVTPGLELTPRLCRCSRLPRSNACELCGTQTPPVLL